METGQGFAVVVDYAHTPDSILHVLRAARALAAGRVIVVFGCGGDRDRAKRPLMGRTAAAEADLTVVTSDNPRTEDPEAIIAQIGPGCRRAASVRIEPDRGAAIALAVAEARAGDVVVIAGKGHETYQEVLGTVIPFDDRAVRAYGDRGAGGNAMKPRSLLAVAGAVGGEPVDADDVGISSVQTDSRLVGAGALFVALAGEHADGHAFVGDAFDHGATAALVRSGFVVNGPAVLVPHTGQALLDLAADERRGFAGTVVAITGANGKTSTKDMAAAVCAERFRTHASPRSFNNEVGLPMTLLGASPDTEVVIAELGARHVGDVQRLMPIADPSIAVVTNVGVAHMEVFGSWEAIVDASAEPIEALDEEDLAILNADDAVCLDLRRSHPCPCPVVRPGLRTRRYGPTMSP